MGISLVCELCGVYQENVVSFELDQTDRQERIKLATLVTLAHAVAANHPIEEVSGRGVVSYGGE